VPTHTGRHVVEQVDRCDDGKESVGHSNSSVRGVAASGGGGGRAGVYRLITLPHQSPPPSARCGGLRSFMLAIGLAPFC